MALVDQNKQPFTYDVLREGEDVTLRIDCEAYLRSPSLEDDPVLMAKAIDILMEAGTVTKIVFTQKRDYEYDYTQTLMLLDLAKAYNQIIKKRIITYQSIGDPKTYAEIQNTVYRMLKSDPLGAYVELKRLSRRESISMQHSAAELEAHRLHRIVTQLNMIVRMLDQTSLIQLAQPYLAGYVVGDRSVYRKLFTPTIRPDFMFTKLMASYPVEGEELASYGVEDTEVTLFRLPNTIQFLYHILPPEFKMSEEKYEIVDTARKVMAEHKPTRSEFVDPQRMRQVFMNVGHDLIEELASQRNMNLREKEIQSMTKILVRYTVGFGLIEVLLQDEKIQDITINAPMGQIPMFLVHEDFDECVTNIIPTVGEAESWASKLRMLSGRPLDEANPILDTDLSLPAANARVGVIAPPLNPYGLAYAFRRHRDRPWTLPLFINNRMLTPLAAGLLSFIIDGSRTLLVAGTRSAGKTALLGSLLTEIMRKYRILTIEDTLELPTTPLRKLGYNIQPMKVVSALTHGSTEVSAEEGIRATLRLGDSALIVGEVRSVEARALYEAMRVGALANVVAGTIHGDSPYGVFDRVVNDLQVPKTSFKATDIVVVANPLRSSDGLQRWRRVTSITEVRKHWTDDPLQEGGFSDLMKYNTKTDQLEPTADLKNGDSDILKAIAGNVKEWSGNWDAVWDNILLRAKIKETIVNLALASHRPDMLEAEFVIQSNDEYHRISATVRDEVGYLESQRIFFEWNEWLKKSIKAEKTE
ncbi:MAG TPA: type II/IV secretion system ATPase subunit [Candidatus Nanoarchaeia archaeon]|nr:type II/IV secretion system ATPase subunit [Candidatus Nanoarchaeia archaeon]